MKKGLLLMLISGSFCAIPHKVSAINLELPPVFWSGRLGAQYRQTVPDSGNDTTQKSYTGEVTGRSYVWQPWFGNWRTRLAATTIKTDDSDRESDGLILSGDGELNLFHLSRFPFLAYYNIQDSRVDVNDELDPGSDDRYIRFGIKQTYRPVSSTSSASIDLIHDEHENLLNNENESNDRAIVNGYMQRGSHRFNTNLQAGTSSQSQNSGQQDDWQAFFYHNYNPDSRFSLSNNLGYGNSKSHSDSSISESSRAQIGTSFFWRNNSERAPLRMRGDLSSNSQRREDFGEQDNDIDETRGSLSLFYLPTIHWRLGIEAGGRVTDRAIKETRTYQQVTVDYSSRTYGLGLFSYSFGGGVARREEQSSLSEDETIDQLNLSHNANRQWKFGKERPVTMSITLGQDWRKEQASIRGDLETLVNRASLGVNYSTARHTTNFYLNAYESKTQGINELETRSVSFTGLHNYRLSRYSSFGLNYGVQVSETSGSGFAGFEEQDEEFDAFEDDSFEDPNEYSRIEAVYRHNRLFNFERLRFQSRARASKDSVYLSNLEESTESEILWENRLTYFIGKLDFSVRTYSIQRPGVEQGGSKTILVTVNRRF